MNNAIEAAGYALLIAFLWFLWPPLTLAGAGLLLVAYANVRAAQSTGKTAGALAAAWAAARRAYAAASDPESRGLRRVA